MSWELEMAVENGDIDRSTVFFLFVFVQRWRRRGVMMYRERERDWEIIIIKRVKEKGKKRVGACVRVVCE